MTRNPRPRPKPEDRDFFARFTLPQDVLDYAFGPNGGTPPPTVTGHVTGRAAAAPAANPPAAEPHR